MQIVPSSILALLLVILLLWRGPYRALWGFLAALPFGAAAAFNLPAVGGASILVADIGALTLFFATVVTAGGMALLAGSMRPGQPGFWMLLLTVYSIFATLVFPTLFEGRTEVFAISRAINTSGIISVPLAPSAGNLTQLFRALLAAMVFLALATVFRVRPDGRTVLVAVAVASGVHVALGWLDVLTFALGLPEILEPIRTANYSMLVSATMAGMKRMVGGFPEASSFGYVSLGLFAFWMQFWIAAPRSRLAGWMLALTALAVLRSTSSAAYVGLVMYMVTFGVLALAVSLRADVSKRGAGLMGAGLVLAWSATVLLFAAYQLSAPVTDFIDRTLLDKLSSSSGVERMSWNTQAMVNFLDTRGLGAGLGSVRASNWLVACLASLGVIGTGLYLAFLGSLARVPAQGADLRSAVIRALKSACLAMVLSQLLTSGTPDLGLIFAAFAGLAAGLSRGAVLEREAGPT